MFKNKKLIIFDIDGTLLDSIEIWNYIDKKLIKDISNIEVDINEIAKQRDEKLKEFSNCENMYLEYLGFLNEKYNFNMNKNDILKLRKEISKQFLINNVYYKPNADKMIRYLKNKGYILVLASAGSDYAINIYKSQNKNIISKADFKEIFSDIYSKDSVTKVKPNPEVYSKIMNKFSVNPKECLVVEDSLVGVEAAKNANIEVAVIYDKYSDHNREQINELSQYQFNNFDEMLNYAKNELETELL